MDWFLVDVALALAPEGHDAGDPPMYRTYRTKLTNIAIAETAIMAKLIQPSSFCTGELTRSPITLRSLANNTTRRIRGGASRPFNIADQKSIFTADIPNQLIASPRIIAAARTA